MEPIPQISKALEIIENVQKSCEEQKLALLDTSIVWVRWKNQCKRVADRFKAIGELLKIYTKSTKSTSVGSNFDDNTLDYPAFDELLTILQKGQALVSNYIIRVGIKSAPTWSDNPEAFKEIHQELKTIKATIPFAFGEQFEAASGSQGAAMLTFDAKQDLEAMICLPRSFQAEDLESDDEEGMSVAVENLVVEPTDSRLPSYLLIDISEITIKAPVWRFERLSKSAKDDGWGCDFVVKVFASKLVEWNKDQMVKEVLALMELRHPHIISLIGLAQG